MGRSERHTVVALEIIRLRLPFPLKGIDFDTGGEFVNWHLIRHAQRNEITYTRAREGKKNDQAYIEQQNFSIVRRSDPPALVRRNGDGLAFSMVINE